LPYKTNGEALRGFPEGGTMTETILNSFNFRIPEMETAIKLLEAVGFNFTNATESQPEGKDFITQAVTIQSPDFNFTIVSTKTKAPDLKIIRFPAKHGA